MELTLNDDKRHREKVEFELSRQTQLLERLLGLFEARIKARVDQLRHEVVAIREQKATLERERDALCRQVTDLQPLAVSVDDWERYLSS